MTFEYPYGQVQDVLRCPITRQGLRLLKVQEIQRINTRIAGGELIHSDGTPIKKALEAGFISQDGRYAYLILDGIIILLANLAIPLVQEAQDPQVSLRVEKKILQDFYDEIGWHRQGEIAASFVDALKWEDLRPVMNDYIHNCHLRVNRYLKNNGRFLLDAGSGPIQYLDYLTYSAGYDYRICVDLSFLALKEARSKLGEKGIYILGDITNIPLQDNAVDGAISLHTVYHVPKDEQISAFYEIHRVLKPGSSGWNGCFSRAGPRRLSRAGSRNLNLSSRKYYAGKSGRKFQRQELFRKPRTTMPTIRGISNPTLQGWIIRSWFGEAWRCHSCARTFIPGCSVRPS
jgi:SAM-dependent methyltransferase/uncharacterized protein YbaR (Trm112 family)